MISLNWGRSYYLIEVSSSRWIHMEWSDQTGRQYHQVIWTRINSWGHNRCCRKITLQIICPFGFTCFMNSKLFSNFSYGYNVFMNLCLTVPEVRYANISSWSPRTLTLPLSSCFIISYNYVLQFFKPDKSYHACEPLEYTEIMFYSLCIKIN